MKHLEPVFYSAVSGNYRQPETLRLRPFSNYRLSPHLAVAFATDSYSLISKKATEVVAGYQSLYVLNRSVSNFLFDTKVQEGWFRMDRITCLNYL